MVTPLSSLMVTTLVAVFTVGGSFTAVTVSGKEMELVLVPSVTDTLIRLVPNRFVVGVITRVRSKTLLGPVTTRLLLTTRLGGLLELLVASTTRFVGSVSASLRVKRTDNGVSSWVVWAATGEIVGAVSRIKNQPRSIDPASENVSSET